MIFDQLPRSYLVWAFRQKLNEAFDIKAVEGDIQGAYMPLKTTIQADICHYMATHNIEDPEGQHFNLKVSGDGAKFSRTSNFLLMSFALLETGKDVLCSNNQCTFAAVKAPEEFDACREPMSSIFKEINELIEARSIEIDGKKVDIDVYFWPFWSRKCWIWPTRLFQSISFSALQLFFLEGGHHVLGDEWGLGNSYTPPPSIRTSLLTKVVAHLKICQFSPLAMNIQPDQAISWEILARKFTQHLHSMAVALQPKQMKKNWPGHGHMHLAWSWCGSKRAMNSSTQPL